MGKNAVLSLSTENFSFSANEVPSFSWLAYTPIPADVYLASSGFVLTLQSVSSVSFRVLEHNPKRISGPSTLVDTRWFYPVSGAFPANELDFSLVTAVIRSDSSLVVSDTIPGSLRLFGGALYITAYPMVFQIHATSDNVCRIYWEHPTIGIIFSQMVQSTSGTTIIAGRELRVYSRDLINNVSFVPKTIPEFSTYAHRVLSREYSNNSRGSGVFHPDLVDLCLKGTKNIASYPEFQNRDVFAQLLLLPIDKLWEPFSIFRTYEGAKPYFVQAPLSLPRFTPKVGDDEAIVSVATFVEFPAFTSQIQVNSVLFYFRPSWSILQVMNLTTSSNPEVLTVPVGDIIRLEGVECSWVFDQK